MTNEDVCNLVVRSLQAVLMAAVVVTSVSAQPSAPEWIIGEWQSNRAAYGREPYNRCLLTITATQLSWRESPEEPPLEFSFSTAATEDDFIVLKVEHEYAFRQPCLHMPSPAYLRFDRNDYFHCMQTARAHQRRPMDECPKPFGGSEFFELTVFASLEQALDHSGARFWTGYRKYAPYG